ncbi:hypothetical protein BU24DRAFT_427920 [Aaosphaeria arxii CBS 175.79]|uniref:Uncharacterized protein n=1 Tax=Aaosphaeria arxii CBS 175.79 TaxID=1450172 RepID=A0A6A5XAT2_9PLEO|nr:uncharacterized protein BU24DRAFT_427920 [Aaosphaeria arxii CBS 175.79]KAF2009884.1 hypothetical protein BU24DRAFT_427920 [Aaosphaeria arxii CBS 175.79]
MKRGSADEVPIPCLDPDDEHLTRLLPSEILSALFSPDLETTYPPDPVATGENPFDPSPIPEDDSEMKQQRKIILRGSIALAVILGLCLLGFWLWWIIWYIPLTRRRREAAQQREMGLAQMERDREQARMRAAESEMGPDGILVPRIRFNAHKGNKDPYDIESIMNMEEGEKSRSICERPDEGNTPANYENKMKEKIENETISERKDSLVPDPVVANPAMPASVEDPDAITPAPPR